MAVHVRLLGPIEVEIEGRVAPLTSQHRLLLARLALSSAVSVDELREVLGDEHSPVSSSTVKSHVSRLRASLGGDGVLRATSAGYRLVPGSVTVDRDRFEELVRSANGAPPAVASARLTEALALWRGPALGDVGGELFALPEAIRLEELRLQSLEARVDAELALGRHERLIPDLERFAAEQPLRERLHRQLAVALAGVGRQADALRAVEQFRRHHVEELGLDPSEELRRLERRILDDDPALAPRATPATRTVPRPMTSLVGRNELIKRVSALVLERRLVVLRGLGGVGKTRVALAAAAAAEDGFGSGVVHVDLARAADDSLLPALLAGALRLPGTSVAEMASLLASEHLLLVLDGCEHVLDGIRSLLDDLLPLAPAVHVLATSRRVLGIPGEVVVAVDGLPRDDAVDLLVQRAADLGNAIDDRSPTVRRLCDALDGLPLAIELAAARTDHVSVEELVESLDRRFDMLRTGDDDDRHGSLLALLDDSVAALADDERKILEAAGTFVGTFRAAAVAAVAEHPDPIDALGGLVRQSLVLATPGEPTAYRLLDTVSAHARVRAAASRSALLWRHAAWHLEEAESVPEVAAALSTVRAEQLAGLQPDIELAMRTFLDVGDTERAARLLAGTATLWRHGSGSHFDAARAALEQVVIRPLPSETAVACRGLASFLARMQVDHDGVAEHTRAGLAPNASSGWTAWCWGALGLHFAVRAMASSSSELASEARHAAEEATRRVGDVDPAWRLPIAWDIGNVCFTLGDIEGAHEALAAALQALGPRPDFEADETLVRACDALALHLLDRDADAMDTANPVLHLLEGSAQDRGWLANQPRAFVAPALAASGETGRATRLLVDALPTAATAANVLNVSDFVVSLGAVRAIEGDWEGAGTLLGAARAFGRRHPIPFRTPMGYALYRRSNDNVRAELGPDRGRAVRERGATLGLDAAVALVLA